MKVTENFIRQKLTYKVFLSMSFLVISLPILFNFKYLLLGEKVKGVMMRVESAGSIRSSAEVSIIKYSVGDRRYEYMGPKMSFLKKESSLNYII